MGMSGEKILTRRLEWLDSHDGRLYRRRTGGTETDTDLAALIPTPPGQSIFTVGDLREVVEKLRERESGTEASKTPKSSRDNTQSTQYL